MIKYGTAEPYNIYCVKIDIPPARMMREPVVWDGMLNLADSTRVYALHIPLCRTQAAADEWSDVHVGKKAHGTWVGHARRVHV